jgi:hypothetical protein
MNLPMEITVAIATLGPRMAQIVLPPPTAGLRYAVFVQSPPALMQPSTRADVSYTALETLGLSHSRNSALAQCETPLLVFADDDIALETAGLLELGACLTQNPQLGFAAGWRAGRLPQTGPRAGHYRLHKRTSGRICAPELMIRTAAVRDAGLHFDTDFGVGAAYPVGEDFIFVCDMLDAGLRGDAFPIITGSHDGISTGDVWSDATILVARRKVLERCFGKAAPFVKLAYALRHRKRLGGVSGAWRFWSGRIKSG